MVLQTDPRYNTLRTEAEAEANGVAVLASPADLTVHVREVVNPVNQVASRRVVGVINNQELPLTMRAISNLSRLTGINDVLVRQLPLEQIERDIRHQLLHRAESLGVVRVPVEGTMSICGLFQPHKRVYAPYLSMMPDVETVAISGSPILDDMITFQTVEGMVKVGDEELKVGIRAKLSSTGMQASGIMLGFYRGRCTNTGIDVKTAAKVSLSHMDADIIRGVFVSLRERVPQYITRTEQLINRCKEIKLENEGDVDSVLEHLSAPEKVKKMVRLAVTHPADCGDLFQNAGVDHVNNLWDAVNIVTHFGKLTNRVSQQISLSQNAVAWAKAVSSSKN